MLKALETPLETDEELALRVQEGNSSAFAQMVERHSKRFFRMAYRILKNKDEAEDMVQSAFLKFWQDPQKWDPHRQTQFTTWFYQVVKNLCLDHLKKKRPDPLPPGEVIISSAKGSDEALDETHRQKQLEEWIEELPDRQQEALNLCFYENFSNQEAAAAMGIRLKALQSLLMRAKESLRGKFQKARRGELA